MQRQLVTTRIIAGILAALLIIAAVVILNDRQTIADLKAATGQNITATRDTIREDCKATDADSHARCVQALENLSSLLKELGGSAGMDGGSATGSFKVQ